MFYTRNFSFQMSSDEESFHSADESLHDDEEIQSPSVKKNVTKSHNEEISDNGTRNAEQDEHSKPIPTSAADDPSDDNRPSVDEPPRYGISPFCCC